MNLCFSSGVFPTSCKSSIIFPLIKKQGLDPEILKNYRTVAKNKSKELELKSRELELRSLESERDHDLQREKLAIERDKISRD